MPDWLNTAFDLVRQERFIDAIASMLDKENAIDMRKFALLRREVSRLLGRDVAKRLTEILEEGGEAQGESCA
jgi:hypothetical protein